MPYIDLYMVARLRDRQIVGHKLYRNGRGDISEASKGFVKLRLIEFVFVFIAWSRCLFRSRIGSKAKNTRSCRR